MYVAKGKCSVEIKCILNFFFLSFLKILWLKHTTHSRPLHVSLSTHPPLFYSDRDSIVKKNLLSSMNSDILTSWRKFLEKKMANKYTNPPSSWLSFSHDIFLFHNLTTIPYWPQCLVNPFNTLIEPEPNLFSCFLLVQAIQTGDF